MNITAIKRSGRFIAVVMAMLLCAFVVPSIAAGEGPLVIEMSSVRVVAGPGGEEEFLPADEGHPGDVIEYTARYRNVSQRSLGNILGTLPVPEGMEYLPGSAIPAQVSASTDGESFGPVPLRRLVRLASGREEQRAVPYRDYRALRWEIGSLGPGQETVVKARARIAEGR
ncbi:hypothetical protein [Desulfuromonas sp.]|uniref:hypothetical protein n=1 Tax=Desulfuromonas sp. TaxID=892 RepID=UPI0025C1F1AF|nr:hypothetical protein [Desulfuromonas sp.]